MEAEREESNTAMNVIRPLTPYVLVFALAFTGSLSIPVHGQVADSIEASLDLDQLRDYRRQRLSVKIQTEREETVEITGNRYRNVFGQTVTERTVQRSGETYKEWTPYKGFNRTTEVEFFETAGYPEQAQRARDFHTVQESKTRWWAKGSKIIGGLSSAFGAIGLTVNLVNPDYSVTSIGPSLLGGGLALVLIGFAGEGGTETVYRPGPPMRYPASQVSGIAAEYNRALYQKLRSAHSETTSRNDLRVEFPARTEVVQQGVRKALSLPGGAQKVLSSETARLKKGDVIVSIDGSELKQESSLSQILSNYSSSVTLQVQILREGESQTVSVAMTTNQ